MSINSYCPCGECPLDPVRWSEECRREALRSDPADEIYADDMRAMADTLDRSGDL